MSFKVRNTAGGNNWALFDDKIVDNEQLSARRKAYWYHKTEKGQTMKTGQEAENLVKQLKEGFDILKPQAEAQILEGIEGFKTMRRDILRNSIKQILLENKNKMTPKDIIEILIKKIEYYGIDEEKFKDIIYNVLSLEKIYAEPMFKQYYRGFYGI